ncbi:hypothetical protein C4579_01115, partial [Candidatus Microgenomates bacterium]
MLAALTFFLISFLVGRKILLLLQIGFSRITQWCAALVVGTVILTLAVFASAFVVPLSKVSIITVMLLVTVFSFLLAKKSIAIRPRSLLKFVKQTAKDSIAFWRQRSFFERLILLTLIILPIWLFGRALIWETDGGLLAGDRLVWVDWPIHMAMATSFAYGGNMPPQNPFFAGNTLTYPFFADFLSGVLLVLGSGFARAFILPGIVLTLAFFGLFIGFIVELIDRDKSDKTNRTYAPGVLALVLSLFWGGLGWIYWIEHVIKEKTLASVLFPPQEYSFWGEKGFWFFSFFFSEILPQRAFLFGLAIFFLICLLLLSASGKSSKKILIFSGILAGITPFFHTHTFLILGMLLGVMVLFGVVEVIRKRLPLSSLLPIIWFAIPFGLLSLAQLPLFLHQSHTISWQFGWMKTPQENIFLFWLKNTGIFIPLILIGFFIKKIPLNIKKLAIVGGIVFLLLNVVSFANWGYDNLKLFTYWYLLSAPLVAGVLIWLWRKNLALRFVAVV